MTFPMGERASDALRWGSAFAVVALVYGTCAWLLLRQNRSELDSSGLTVMLDLPKLPDLPIAPNDRASVPVREAGQNNAGAPGELASTNSLQVENDRLANLAGDANGGGKMKDERPAGTDKVDVATAEQPVRPEMPLKAEMPAETGGAAKPLSAARPTTAPDGNPADFLARMPIDTSITVYQWRSPNSSKGTKQSRGLVEFNIANELKQLLQKRPLNRPVSIAALPANHEHGNAAGHQSGPASAADATPERNAIGILIDHRANPQSGLSQGDAPRQPVNTLGRSAPGPLGIAIARTGEYAHLSEVTRAESHSVQGPNRGSLLPATAFASIGGPRINGNGITHPGFMTGTLGRPTNTFAGGLNGTDFHARHP